MRAVGGLEHPDRVAEQVQATLKHVRGMRDELVDFVTRLTAIESPTDHPETQVPVQAVLGEAFEDLDYDVSVLPGRTSGGVLYARPKGRRRGAAAQLLVGHTDTVWPLGTLECMPIQEVDGRLHGPGTLDMKGGLTLIVFALRALRDLGLTPSVTPVVLINSDEEIGSPDSKNFVRLLARRVDRALILEPGMGTDGRLKTARKGVGGFDVTIRGRAAHAGLEPELGASAIQELSHVIQRLHVLSDPSAGTTVNVGVVEGGVRPNVVAPHARARVDVRVTTLEHGRLIEEAIRALRPVTPGVTLSVSGGIGIPPLERTPRNCLLWERAREEGLALGWALEESAAGGGSDGNTTSLFTATLDGLGCVGDGAHADHEHIVIAPSVDRCALLARLLLAPALGRS